MHNILVKVDLLAPKVTHYYYPQFLMIQLLSADLYISLLLQ